MSTDHVLVIGIDGVRYDSVRRLPTPHLDSIAERGFLVPTRVNDAGPTISGPSWATVFTGVLADRHRIFNNDFRGNMLADFPDVLTLAGRLRPGIETWVGAAWPPLVTADSGGPLFAGGGVGPGLPAEHEPDWSELDELITAQAARFIAEHDGGAGSLLVCYLGAPDEIAHRHGVSTLYEESIIASDRRIGRLLAAIEGRRGEDWTVIAVTDHGHVDAGGHGGESPQERTAWIAACGPDISPAPDDDAPDDTDGTDGQHHWPQQADVAAHAMATLRAPAEAWSYMTGRPFTW
ncbi:alkaline phosphatase family protein [Microlunatus endophyticus]|nr:alkaline phosphatase family protein [Microlunatus endophyticus]